jgi:hypothetical protein
MVFRTSWVTGVSLVINAFIGSSNKELHSLRKTGKRKETK